MELINDLLEFFPLKSVSNVVSLCKYEISKSNPRLAIISIILGWFEEELTNQNCNNINEKQSFPELSWNEINLLWLQFVSFTDELNDISKENTEDEAIKAVADFVWSKLLKSFFKDKFHVQTLYSFIKVKRLDCFGIAITTLSFLQHIGFNQIHLSLSEDHAWLHYGSNQTAEVTWHGKGNEQKRGKPIEFGCDVDIAKNWLYLGKCPIKCNRHMEVCAIINAMNPGINSNTDSEVVGQMQQELLWCIYDLGHISRFPVAICNLADLEEIEPSKKNIVVLQDLYEEAIACVVKDYDDYHVYPYTYFAGYLYRDLRFEEAIFVWLKAAQVISRYNYSKEDEEIYKEFAEITNVLLIEVIRNAEFQNLRQIPKVFIALLKYFDFLCQWENESKTPIFHEQWAKSFIKIFSAMEVEVRIKTSLEFNAALPQEPADATPCCQQNNEIVQKSNTDAKQQPAANIVPLKHSAGETLATTYKSVASTDEKVTQKLQAQTFSESILQNESLAQELLQVVPKEPVKESLQEIVTNNVLKEEAAEKTCLEPLQQNTEVTPVLRKEVLEEAPNIALKTPCDSLVKPQLELVVYSSKINEILKLMTQKKLNAAAIRLIMCRQPYSSKGADEVQDSNEYPRSKRRRIR